MPHLSMSFLGPLQVTLDGTLITAFHSDKVRALLAYLAVEADRPHRRESLAGLLWPDWPESSARKNLSNTLYSLRQALGDQEASTPFFLIAHDEIQLNPQADCETDVALLLDWATAGDPVRWQDAVDLVSGPFLEGFSLADSAAFEDWLRLERERLGER